MNNKKNYLTIKSNTKRYFCYSNQKFSYVLTSDQKINNKLICCQTKAFYSSSSEGSKDDQQLDAKSDKTEKIEVKNNTNDKAFPVENIKGIVNQ